MAEVNRLPTVFCGRLYELGMTVGKIGLVVITLERYFKIEHPGAYRKYYREWTTALAVAIPWISGFCTFGIPALASMKEVPGQCPRQRLPSKQAQMVSNLYNTVCVGITHGMTQQVKGVTLKINVDKL